MDITKEQIKRIYALGSALGILERGSKEDDLHALVYNLSGKSSVSALSDAEFLAVERELMSRMRFGARSEPLQRPAIAQKPQAPGMMNSAQQALAWRLIYRLCELDPREATPGERMCGAIRKTLDMDAAIEAPFVWVRFADGGRLIEQLKRYVRSAEARQAREVG